jgi:hypothetical protein
MNDETMKRLACGCSFGNIGKAFVMRPCSPTCDLYAESIETARKQDKPIQEIDPATLMQHESELKAPSACPYCGRQNDLVSGKTDEATPGSILLCINCARPGVLTEINTTRKATHEELEQFELNGDFVLMRNAVRRSIRERLMNN